MGQKRLATGNPDALSTSAQSPRGDLVEWVYAGLVLLATLYERAGVILAFAADGHCLGRFNSRPAARRAVLLATHGADCAADGGEHG